MGDCQVRINMKTSLPEILPQTFIHVPGIGHPTEKLLWDAGITTWRKFVKSKDKLPAYSRFPSGVFNFLEKSEQAFQSKSASFFGKYLPRSEWWRLYASFPSKVVYLDIETTGLSAYYDDVTIVGLYDGKQLHTLIAGHNLYRLQALLKPYEILVTFNGSLFDLPFLKAKFPKLKLPPIHLDLRFLLRRVGYSGGLKEIERQVGLRRDKQTEAVDGLMATVLWARYQQGDIGSFEQLLKYNAADITGLQSLMTLTYRKLFERLREHGGGPRKSKMLQFTPPRKVSIKVTRVNGSAVKLHVDQVRTTLKMPKRQGPLITLDQLLSKIKSAKKVPKVVGIDLCAAEYRATGWALLSGPVTHTKLVRTDDEIFHETIQQRPDIISIDSPLTLPIGRCCTKDSCECRAKGILRECERTLWRRGVRVFPCLLPSMQKLTERGMRLAKRFRKHGYEVIESYPGAAQDIMRIPRKKSSELDLAQGLGSFGVKGSFLVDRVTHDELDAITSGIVGYFYLAGQYEGLGNKREDYLIIPKLESKL